jgi:biopolymer transport protein ExbD
MANSPTYGETPALTDDEIRRMQYKKALRRKRRKDRDSEGEIHDLNIYPMLDMMTIILVFLLKSYSASSVTINSVDPMTPPTSSITSKHILLENKAILDLTDFKVDPSNKPEGANGMLIAPLKDAFVAQVNRLKKLESLNPETMPFTGELSVIADQHAPYRLVMEILYTAGQAELGNYRFIVIQGESGGAPVAAAPKAGG